MIDAILVPSGAELAAVKRGLKRVNRDRQVGVIGIPVGPGPVSKFLTTLHFPLEKDSVGEGITGVPRTRILVAGVCGSLSPDYGVGDCCLVDGCFRTYAPLDPNADNNYRQFSSSLTKQLQQSLFQNNSSAQWIDTDSVLAASCDHTLCLAEEKRALGQSSEAGIVDMEGFAILDSLQPYAVDVAMLRVVSDRYDCTLPNLNSAISPEGDLKPLRLASAMLRRPRAAVSLIRGSLAALNQLELAIADIFALEEE